MRKREEFAVSLRKTNKQIKLNEKRAKIGTKSRPGIGDFSNVSELLCAHPLLNDPSLTIVSGIINTYLCIIGWTFWKGPLDFDDRDGHRLGAFFNCVIKTINQRPRPQVSSILVLFTNSSESNSYGSKAVLNACRTQQKPSLYEGALVATVKYLLLPWEWGKLFFRRNLQRDWTCQFVCLTLQPRDNEALQTNQSGEFTRAHFRGHCQNEGRDAISINCRELHLATRQHDNC